MVLKGIKAQFVVPFAVAKPAMDAVRTLMIFEMDGMELREV